MPTNGQVQREEEWLAASTHFVPFEQSSSAVEGSPARSSKGLQLGIGPDWARGPGNVDRATTAVRDSLRETERSEARNRFVALPLPEEGSFSGRVTAPVRFFARVLEVWGLDRSAAAKLLGYEDDRLAHELLSGAASLRTRDAKDRIRHVFVIREALHQLFRDERVEREWLREPRPELNNNTPIQLLLEGSMENMLLVRQLVEWMVGR